MPAGENQPSASGAGGPNLTSDKQLIAAVEAYEKQLKSTTATQIGTTNASKRLVEQLNKLEDQSKKSYDKVTILGRAMQAFGKDSAEARLATEQMAQSLSKTAGVMTETESLASKSRIAAIGAAADVAVKDSRDFVILQKAKRSATLEDFRDSMEKQAELGKAKTANGDWAGGIWQGAVAKLKSNGAAAAESVGGFFGTTGETMELLAGAAAVLGGVFIALKYAIEGSSQSALDAAKAGNELSFSLGAVGDGAEFAMKTNSAAAMTYGLSSSALLGLLATNNKYASSLFGTGEAYLSVISKGEGYRNEVRNQTVDFVGRQAAVGAALGLTADESVKMGSELGALSRSGIKPTREGFMAASLEAKRLGLSIDATLKPTMMWAEAIADSGDGALVAARKTLQVTSAIEALGNANELGFKNMNPAEMSKLAEGFSKLMTSMEPTRLAALSMKPGESFENVLGDLGGNTSKSGLMDAAIKNAMSMVGAKVGTALTNTQALTLGSILGGDSSDLVGTQKIGRLAARTQSVGQVRGAVADQLDQKYNAAESVGAGLSQGADVTGMMAAYLKGILDIMIDWGNMKIFSSPHAADLQVKREKEESGNRASSRYGGLHGARLSN